MRALLARLLLLWALAALAAAPAQEGRAPDPAPAGFLAAGGARADICAGQGHAPDAPRCAACLAPLPAPARVAARRRIPARRAAATPRRRPPLKRRPPPGRPRAPPLPA